MQRYCNGEGSSEEEGREPSYVRLARCVSGYSTLNYDPERQVVGGRSPAPMATPPVPEEPPAQQEQPPPPPASFIEQRIERLYGPGSLAQVFHSRCSVSPRTPRSTATNNTLDRTPDLSESIPVMRLLRPEFRARLTSTSPSPSPSCPPRNSRKSNSEVVTTPTAPKEEVKDGSYFLEHLKSEVERLERIAESCEEESRTCDSEAGCGVLRAVGGKARLLVAQKLEQFRGLCRNNLDASPSEAFPTTNQDLAGFWDMVMIQVRDVHRQYDNLHTLRSNGWTEPLPDPSTSSVAPTSKSRARPVKKKIASAPSKEVEKARDAARRKMIEERRRNMRQHIAAAPNSTSQSSTLFIV